MEFLEYINRGFYLLSGILLFLALFGFLLEMGSIYSKEKPDKDKTKANFTIVFLTAFVAIAVPIYDGYSNLETTRENIKLFNYGNYLQCISGFKHTLVAKSRGWSENNAFFIKEDLMINALSCSKSQVQSYK